MTGRFRYAPLAPVSEAWADRRVADVLGVKEKRTLDVRFPQIEDRSCDSASVALGPLIMGGHANVKDIAVDGCVRHHGFADDDQKARKSRVGQGSSVQLQTHITHL